MITLKKISQLSSLAIILFGLSGCAGGKETSYKFEQKPPFTLGEVFYQDWVAGVQGGGSGTHVHITIDSYTDDVVIMDIYFRNSKQPPTEYQPTIQTSPKDASSIGSPAPAP